MSAATHPTVLNGTVAGRAVALPLRRAARDLGWVVSFSPEDTPYADQDLKVVAGIAVQAALSLHTALLLEQERATIARLEELGDLKTQFVASVSHELRTPLTSIIGYTELLLEILDDPTLRTYLDDMRRESTALEALINDLLDTSRIESGTLRLEIKRDDPARALHEAVELVRHSHPGRGIVVEVDPDTGTIPVDHSRLRQVITNLLDNAIKYSPEHSAVSVAMRRVPGQRGEHIEVTVSDHGPGIPVAQREAVFQRFNRLHTTTHAGTGIGLYLVRALVEAHGGTVRVADSETGGGSRFIVRLPPQAREPERPNGPNVRPSGWWPRRSLRATRPGGLSCCHRTPRSRTPTSAIPRPVGAMRPRSKAWPPSSARRDPSSSEGSESARDRRSRA